MNRYLNGDKILNKGYSMADDKHAFTEGKNLGIIDKKLRILTRREKAKGLVWDMARGFYEKEFDFSSIRGVIRKKFFASLWLMKLR